MPLIINRSQQIVTAGVYPRSVYSRMLLFRMTVPAIAPFMDGGVTPVVGQRVWILGIDIWIYPMAAAGWLGIESSFMYGTQQETNLTVIRTQWESLMRFSRPGTQSVFYFGPGGHQHYDMNVLLKGQAWRFGLVSSQAIVCPQCNVMVGLHICEG